MTAVALSSYIASGIANPDQAADAAAAGLKTYVSLDANYTLPGDRTYAAPWRGDGGVLTRGTHAVTGNFWAPETVAMFDQNGTGTVTLTSSATASVLWFGAKGDASDDTYAFEAWISAIKGKHGHIPRQPGGYYSLPNGISFNSHHYTVVTCDPGGEIQTTQSSGYAYTLNDCIGCDLDFPLSVCGYSGCLISSDVGNATYNRVGFPGGLIATGALVSMKPTDPLANRIGIYIEGPPSSAANYYNTIKQSAPISGFETGIAIAMPSGSDILNANANLVSYPQIENFWFGIYINGVENQVIGARWFESTANATDMSAPAECLRIGDGTLGAAFNYVQGITETGEFHPSPPPPSSYAQAFNCRVATFQNQIIILDNCPNKSIDSGANDYWTRNVFLTQAPAFSASGVAYVSAPSATWTKIAYATSDFDTNSNYSTANSRFTPSVAGYYQINAAISTAGGSGTGILSIGVYKNGAAYAFGDAVTNNSGGPNVQVNALVQLNGTSDYVEIYGYQSSSDNPLSIGSASSTVKFSGALVRSS